VARGVWGGKEVAYLTWSVPLKYWARGGSVGGTPRSEEETGEKNVARGDLKISDEKLGDDCWVLQGG